MLAFEWADTPDLNTVTDSILRFECEELLHTIKSDTELLCASKQQRNPRQDPSWDCLVSYGHAWKADTQTGLHAKNLSTIILVLILKLQVMLPSTAATDACRRNNIMLNAYWISTWIQVSLCFLICKLATHNTKLSQVRSCKQSMRHHFRPWNLQWGSFSPGDFTMDNGTPFGAVQTQPYNTLNLSTNPFPSETPGAALILSLQFS